MTAQADVCLFLEGTYPYVSGGVANWVHSLITDLSHLSFHLVCIVPPQQALNPVYTIPKNVVCIQNLVIQKLPTHDKPLSHHESQLLIDAMEKGLINLYERPNLKTLHQILEVLRQYNGSLGTNTLLNSEEAWKMTERLYVKMANQTSYLNFFWSERGLLSGLYSVLLAELPQASVYHALCTGYAGLFLARARVETGRPCLITEHGIYTNERRIEIASAEWLEDQRAMNLNITRTHNLKDYWINTFAGYSRMCYEACTKIITLHQGNQKLQISDGAPPQKLLVIPNGIDVEKYAHLKREEGRPPTIALIGRVVPIKDVKTYIRVVALLKKQITSLVALVLGHSDEDENYYQECLDLAQRLDLGENLVFKGQVKLEDYLSKIDLIVLTSVSESQPLVILEAGAAGIPFVATDTGSCRELAEGKADENPPLGKGGLISPLVNAESLAQNIYHLLTDHELYAKCSEAIKKRVTTYYNREILNKAYLEIYEKLMHTR